jgi:hypothetical protein
VEVERAEASDRERLEVADARVAVLRLAAVALLVSRPERASVLVRLPVRADSFRVADVRLVTELVKEERAALPAGRGVGLVAAVELLRVDVLRVEMFAPDRDAGLVTAGRRVLVPEPAPRLVEEATFPATVGRLTDGFGVGFGVERGAALA